MGRILGAFWCIIDTFLAPFGVLLVYFWGSFAYKCVTQDEKSSHLT